MVLGQGLVLEGKLAALVATTKDASEGVEAFAEGREPRFEDR